MTHNPKEILEKILEGCPKNTTWYEQALWANAQLEDIWVIDCTLPFRDCGIYSTNYYRFLKIVKVAFGFLYRKYIENHKS